MHERPIGDLVDALRGIGARVDYTGQGGISAAASSAPENLSLEKLRVRGDVSSQFLTALLMALPLSGKPARIEVQGELISKPYVEITLNVMKRFGIEVKRTGWRYFDVPARHLRFPRENLRRGRRFLRVLFPRRGRDRRRPGARRRASGAARIQGDVRFTEVLERMGAKVSLGDDFIEVKGGGKLKPIDVDLNHIPDAAMTAAVLALFADGPSVIRNVASWRVKETDRLAAMATELRKLGAQVEEGADFLKINPGKLQAGVAIDTYDDHRMAMSFSLVALGGVPVRDQRPAVRRQDLSGLLRGVSLDPD